MRLSSANPARPASSAEKVLFPLGPRVFDF
jgi:hypothetical protein